MADDLSRVERALADSVRTGDSLLTEIASHLIVAGGKRVRPGFAIAAAAAVADVGSATDDVVMGAVSVELVHLGSLYHDDVMDEAQIRRTVDSVNARWGNLKAILAGDFLLAKASEIAAQLGTEVAGLLAATIGRLCEGQVLELQNAYNVDRTESAYLASIEGKTAALFASACRIGAIVGGLDRDHVNRLTDFGTQFGYAFQIVDDILDVTATDAQLGKPAGNDLVEGVYTLPVIRSLQGQNGEALRQILGRQLTESDRDAARHIVRSNGAIPASVEVAKEYVDAAVATVSTMQGPGAAALTNAAEHLLTNIPVAT